VLTHAASPHNIIIVIIIIIITTTTTITIHPVITLRPKDVWPRQLRCSPCCGNTPLYLLVDVDWDRQIAI